jgi:hypothetical protein
VACSTTSTLLHSGESTGGGWVPNDSLDVRVDPWTGGPSNAGVHVDSEVVRPNAVAQAGT